MAAGGGAEEAMKVEVVAGKQVENEAFHSLGQH
jgi:hypothetical protein